MLGAARRTKVRHHALLSKFRGAVARDQTSSTRYAIPAAEQEKRTVLADGLHAGDAAEYYLEKRWFYRSTRKHAAQLVPTWDRVAQALIMLSRPAPRRSAPCRMAFPSTFACCPVWPSP